MPEPSKTYQNKLNELINVIVEVAEGNYDVEVPVSSENDELDAIAMGFSTMLDEIKEKVKQTEQSENKFRKLQETSTDAIIIANEDLRIISWNNGARAIFGFDEKEILGRSVMNIVPENYRNAFRKVIEIMKNDPEIRVSNQATELEGLHKKGTVFPIEFSLNSWQTDGKIYYCSIVRDITLRKEAENALKESEEKYRSLIEHMNDGVLYVDNDDRIMFVNERFCEITGYSVNDLVGKVARDVFFDKDSEAYKNMGKIIAERKKEKSSVMELPIKNKNGKIRWMLNSGAPLYNREGKVIGSVGILADIHALKTAQEKILEKNKDLSNFIYRASHDLKGPLSSVKGVVHLAMRELKGHEECMKYMGMIDQSVVRLDEILNDLIGLARLSQKEPEKTEVDLEKKVDLILEDASRLKNFSKIEVRKNIKHKKYNTDRGIILSILQNLIENAIKYHKTNIPNPYVEINITATKKELEIAIIDNGPGIEKELQEKVFDMFYRGSYESQGTGLGLYLVKRSVEKLGGEILMSSAPGEDTAFRVTLPL